MPIFKMSGNKLVPEEQMKRLRERERDKNRHRLANRSFRSTYRWKKLSAEVIAEQPWCSVCGLEGTATDPLTVDHIVSVKADADPFDRDNLTVLHRSENSRKGA